MKYVIKLVLIWQRGNNLDPFWQEIHNFVIQYQMNGFDFYFYYLPLHVNRNLVSLWSLFIFMNRNKLNLIKWRKMKLLCSVLIVKCYYFLLIGEENFHNFSLMNFPLERYKILWLWNNEPPSDFYSHWGRGSKYDGLKTKILNTNTPPPPPPDLHCY